MDINNLTRFPCMRFSASDQNGDEFGVVMAKMTYDINSKGEVFLSNEQEPFSFTDIYQGDMIKSSLFIPSDFIGYKRGTDVIANVQAWCPNGLACPSWESQIQVFDFFGLQIDKKIRITGPRMWVPKWKTALNESEQKNWKQFYQQFDKWELTLPKPITNLPIQYEYTFGGTLSKGKDITDKAIQDAYEYNPIGLGIIDREWTDHTKTISAPQIENADDPILEPYKYYLPSGLGAVPPSWLPRRPLAGTFDQSWLENVWPAWPHDYDFSYNNSAASNMFKKDYFLQGNININLINLSKNNHHLQLKIKDPTSYIIAYDNLENLSYEVIRLNVDTIVIDGLSEDTKNWRVYITSRAVYDINKVKKIVFKKQDDFFTFLPNQYNKVYKVSEHPNKVAVYLDKKAFKDG